MNVSVDKPKRRRHSEQAPLSPDRDGGPRASLLAARRTFVTVLFTDVVDSTGRAVEMGDHGWLDLMATHDAMSLAAVERFGGHVVRTTGDGVVATFGHVMGGALCAACIVEQSAGLGLQVRAGLHAGECERCGGREGGLVFHIGARIAALAGPDQILVSQTVADLVMGSGLEFELHGRHVLKGIEGEWTVYELRSREGDVVGRR